MVGGGEVLKVERLKANPDTHLKCLIDFVGFRWLHVFLGSVIVDKRRVANEHRERAC